MARHGVISRSDLDIFRFVDTPQDALEILQSTLETEPEAMAPGFAHSKHPNPEPPVEG